MSHGIPHPWISPGFRRFGRGGTRQAYDRRSTPQYPGVGRYRRCSDRYLRHDGGGTRSRLANSPERRQRRRQFVDELKAHVPVHPITGATAEIIARVGGEQAAKGNNLPFIDLIIGACALELGFAIGTDNTRDFDRIADLKVISL